MNILYILIILIVPQVATAYHDPKENSFAQADTLYFYEENNEILLLGLFGYDLRKKNHTSKSARTKAQGILANRPDAIKITSQNKDARLLKEEDLKKIMYQCRMESNQKCKEQSSCQMEPRYKCGKNLNDAIVEMLRSGVFPSNSQKIPLIFMHKVSGVADEVMIHFLSEHAIGEGFSKLIFSYFDFSIIDRILWAKNNKLLLIVRYNELAGIVKKKKEDDSLFPAPHYLPPHSREEEPTIAGFFKEKPVLPFTSINQSSEGIGKNINCKYEPREVLLSGKLEVKRSSCDLSQPQENEDSVSYFKIFDGLEMNEREITPFSNILHKILSHDSNENGRFTVIGHVDPYVDKDKAKTHEEKVANNKAVAKKRAENTRNKLVEILNIPRKEISAFTCMDEDFRGVEIIYSKSEDKTASSICTQPEAIP